MALLDYSIAYNRTWKERLLSKLHDYGTPRQVTKWIAAFLRTRTAEVVINGTKSRRVRMKQGLPQGSVLSPLLFILFINDITKDIPADVTSPLFADDASLYSTNESKEVAEERLKVAVSAVERKRVVHSSSPPTRVKPNGDPSSPFSVNGCRLVTDPKKRILNSLESP